MDNFSSILNLYNCLIELNVKFNSYIVRVWDDRLSALIPQEGDMEEAVSVFSHRYVSKAYQQDMMRFLRRDDMQERFQDGPAISMEFQSADELWMIANLTLGEVTPEGELISVLFTLQTGYKNSKRYYAKLQEEKRLHDVLYALCQDYIAIYMVDLDRDEYEIQAVTKGLSPEHELVSDEREGKVFSRVMKKYVETFVYEDDKKLVYEMVQRDNILQQFENCNFFDIRYRVKTKVAKVIYFEMHLVDMTEAQGPRRMVMAWRCVDDVMKKVIKQEEMIRVSEQDALTKINNRGAGEKKMDEYLLHGKRGMFCLFDVNKFKQINDNYGHDVGDKVLKEVAKKMQRPLRGQDMVMRLGGDEFAFFVMGVMDEGLGSLVIERVIASIEDAEIEEIPDYKVRISLGAVFVAPGQYKDFNELYRMADCKMYECKKSPDKEYAFFDPLMDRID